MVRWYHLIMTAYGFWLPNDPRGSWSDFVGSWDLYRYRPATKVNDYRSYAHDPHDRAKRLAARSGWPYPAQRARMDVRKERVYHDFANDENPAATPVGRDRMDRSPRP